MKTRTKDLLFVALLGAVVALVILVSGQETTKKVPDDAAHRPVYQVLEKSGGKREAERLCEGCHNGTMNPLPPGHPPKNRCLFCHKVQRQAR